MKRSMMWACALAVLLWAGAQVMAQGKGQGKAEMPRAGAASRPAQAPPAGGVPSGKPADPGGKGKQAVEKAPAKSILQAGQDRKAQQAVDAIAKGKGKNHQQQLQALDKQLRHEQAKHMDLPLTSLEQEIEAEAAETP